MTDSAETNDQLESSLRAGDEAVFAALFAIHRPRLWQLIHFRLDNRIRTRVDVDDVLQEIYLAAESRLVHFIGGDFQSLFLWLRLVAAQTLSNVHRTHLFTEARSVSREAPQFHAGSWSQTSFSLTQQFVAHLTSPSMVMAKEELLAKVRACIEGMNDTDREVLALRHFEELTNQEVAAVLRIEPKAASNRYMRALERLRGIVDKLV